MPGVTAGTLDSTCVENDIPCFIAEMGRGRARTLMRIDSYRAEKVDEKSQGRVAGNARSTRRCSFEGWSVCTRYKLLEVLEELSPEKDMYVIQVCDNPMVSTGEKCLVMGFIRYAVNEQITRTELSLGQ